MAYKGWSKREAIPWDDIPDDQPEALEAGIYGCTVVETEAKPTKDNEPSVQVILSVEEKYGADEELKRRVYDNFTFTRKAAFKPKQFAKATGINLPETSGFDDVSDFAKDIEGAEVWVELQQSEYRGRVNNKVRTYIHDDDVEEKAAAFEAGPQEDAPKQRRRRTRAKPEDNGASAKGTEEIKDPPKDDPEPEEPKKARRTRRRART